MKTLNEIRSQKLVAVIRGAKEEDVLSITDALRKGGINIFEITADTPNVFSLIKKISQKWKGEVVVGAGTVLDQETARLAITSGAQFIFSPIIDKETIQLTKRYGVVSIPGAYTPTEILKAYEYGADIIKVFPASALGPGYIKDIAGPFPYIPLMPTGGVDLSNINEYFKKGAVAAGLGSSLVKIEKEMDTSVLDSITKKAKQFCKSIEDVNKNEN